METFRHRWTVDQAKATIILIHGTGEHHGRYQHVAALLNKHGYEVESGDLPGYGRSAGLRGHVDRFEDYLTAVEQWVNEALNANREKRPVFILGHSLGGLIATRFVQEYKDRHKLAGLILSSPCLQLKMPVSRLAQAIANWLDRKWPTLRLPNNITPQMVTRHPQVRLQYRSDPYNYPKVSVRWFNELRRAMQQAWVDGEKIDLPLLVLQAGDDCIIDRDGVENFFLQTASKEKQFIAFPGLYHEIMNEPEQEMVLQTLVEWLDEKSKSLEM